MTIKHALEQKLIDLRTESWMAWSRDDPSEFAAWLADTIVAPQVESLSPSELIAELRDEMGAW